MRKTLLLTLTIVVCLVATGVAADTVQYTSNLIPNTLCDWGPLNLTVSKFDASGGATLNSVTLNFYGSVAGTIKYENKGSAGTITGHLQANESLYDTSNVLLLSTTPSAIRSDALPAYDGVTDFAGPSGRTYTGVTGSATGNWTSATPLYLAMFTGPGSISLPTYASASSYVTGGGNVSYRFTTLAGAYMTVTYDYDAIPEPGTLILVSLGLAGVGYWRRRRGKRAE